MSSVIHNAGIKLPLIQKVLYKPILDLVNLSTERRGDSKACFEWVSRKIVSIPRYSSISVAVQLWIHALILSWNEHLSIHRTKNVLQSICNAYLLNKVKIKINVVLPTIILRMMEKVQTKKIKTIQNNILEVSTEKNHNMFSQGLVR